MHARLLPFSRPRMCFHIPFFCSRETCLRFFCVCVCGCLCCCLYVFACRVVLGSACRLPLLLRRRDSARNSARACARIDRTYVCAINPNEIYCIWKIMTFHELECYTVWTAALNSALRSRSHTLLCIIFFGYCVEGPVNIYDFKIR